MRLYSFVNMYLQGIHAGIQTAHLVGEMSREWEDSSIFQDWRDEHKTIIVLNGGPNGWVKATQDKLSYIGRELGLPTASFYESQEALGGILTATGIIVPAEIYSMPAGTEFRNDPVATDLKKILDSYKLAS